MYAFFTVSWHTAYMAQDTKQKKTYLTHFDKKKRTPGITPTWLRYQAQKKQREPGPNRYRATKFKVSQLTVKRAKSKIQTPSTKRLSNSYVCTILCATSKGKFTKFGYFLLEDLFKTEANMFPLLFKVGFFRLHFLVKLFKELSI